MVTELGNNAVNQSAPEWGPYEYLNILDSLRKRGFTVISEMRKKGIDDEFYANKIVGQIDSLFKLGVKTSDIIVVGASAGSRIAMLISAELKRSDVHYVI